MKKFLSGLRKKKKNLVPIFLHFRKETFFFLLFINGIFQIYPVSNYQTSVKQQDIHRLEVRRLREEVKEVKEIRKEIRKEMEELRKEIKKLKEIKYQKKIIEFDYEFDYELKLSTTNQLEFNFKLKLSSKTVNADGKIISSTTEKKTDFDAIFLEFGCLLFE